MPFDLQFLASKFVEQYSAAMYAIAALCQDPVILTAAKLAGILPVLLHLLVCAKTDMKVFLAVCGWLSTSVAANCHAAVHLKANPDIKHPEQLQLQKVIRQGDWHVYLGRSCIRRSVSWS